MDFFKRLRKGERMLLVACFLLAAFCLFMLVQDDFDFDSAFSNAPEIGQITYRQNDARHRSKDNLVWYSAKQDQKIRVGDAVFSGSNSQTNVQLKKGGDVTIGENSLVVFSEINKEKVANLVDGNFRLKVNGAVKIAINGEVATLEGKNSEVQLVMKENQKPRVKLLRGVASVTTKTKKVELKETKSEVIETAATKDLPAAPPEPAPVAPPLPAPIEKPTGLARDRTVNYVWRMYDLYDQRESELFARKSLPPLLKVPTELTWSKSVTDLPATVQISRFNDFREMTEYTSETGAIEIPLVHVGENFWRVTFDKTNWSTVERFIGQTGFLPNAVPSATVSARDLPFLNGAARATIALSTKVEQPAGFVVQASIRPDFDHEDTRTLWTPKRKFKVSFKEPGRYYYRFRTVNKDQEVSDWSKVESFRIFMPYSPSAPRLARIKRDGFVGEDFPMDWNSQGAATKVEIFDSKGQKVSEFNSDKAIWQPKAPGNYVARAFTFNTYGQKSKPSGPVEMRVRPKPLPIVAKKEKPPERKPAQEKTRTRLHDQITQYFNEKYKSSVISTAGMLWTVQSTQQTMNGAEAPIATGLGVRVMRWWKRHGLEGSLKAGVFGFNAAGSRSSMKDLEARYHYRFYTPFPFGWARELQISGFMGYEMYRASGGTMFASQYDLVKFGTMLNFPWRTRWASGGEFVYGHGLDASSKYEISGHLHYYLSRDWTLGVGYRLHLFQAGSTKSAGSGVLPYREGYTEGFTVLDYHF